MVVDYLLSGQRNTFSSLDNLAERYLGDKKLDVVKTQYWEKGINTYDVPLATLSEYNVKDCYLTLKVAEHQFVEVMDKKLLPLVNLKGEESLCVAEIEAAGLGIDEQVRQELEETYTKRYDTIKSEIWKISKRRFSLDSPKQLSAFLYGGTYPVGARCWEIREYKKGPKLVSYKDKILKSFERRFEPLPNTEAAEEGQWSTSKATLVSLQKSATGEEKEVLSLLLERSAISQNLKTFICGIQEHVINGVVHGKLNQVVTATGRFSSSKPNKQNIPRGNTSLVKRMFIPQLGWFVAGDAAQLEWRCAMFLSQDPVCVQEIRDKVDQHSEVRESIFKGKVDRVIAKIFNFRMIFLGSPYAFYMDNDMPDYSLSKWTGIVEAFWDKYRGLYDWHMNNINTVYENGGWLRSITGRTFHFEKYETRYGMEYNKSQIANYPIQSFAGGDCVPLAMVKMRQDLSDLTWDQARMCNQVHDDVMYDTRKQYVDRIAETQIRAFRAIPQLCQQQFGVEVNVPFDGEVKISDKNWMEMTVWS